MTTNRHQVVIWLYVVCAAVFFMVVVGGITRLTQSGLSMVDWRPIMGAIPPLNEGQWQAVFDAYKEYPEYQKINLGMTLDEFKFIFFWEYSHRLLGRLIGLLYFIPFMVFLFRKSIDPEFIGRLWVGLILGGLQGLMGWYMVKSGLVDVPHVSHYRLAAHLLLAIFILAYLYWIILALSQTKRHSVDRGSANLLWIVVILLVVQLLFGAFTAGLNAGYGFNTYPLMHGQFLADAAVMMNPLWVNVIENGVMIQFIHRWVALLLLVSIVAFVFRVYGSELQRPALVLLAVTLVQFGLGVATLLLRVPVAIGSLHQAIACVVVLAVTYLVFVTRDSTTQ